MHERAIRPSGIQRGKAADSSSGKPGGARKRICGASPLRQNLCRQSGAWGLRNLVHQEGIRTGQAVFHLRIIAKRRHRPVQRQSQLRIPAGGCRLHRTLAEMDETKEEKERVQAETEKERQKMKDHEAEMERMKNIYESMLKEIQETFQEKLKQLQDELASANEQVQLYKTGMESHEAELEKMKKLYDEQLLEVQTAFREKNAELQGQIDRFKAQLGSLLAD